MSDLAKYLEHTVLKPDTVLADVRTACATAMEYQLASVFVPPLYMRDARRLLGEDARIRLGTVVGYPMGYSAIAAKSEEIKRAIDEGADHIDAVINIAAVKNAAWNHVEHDIDSLARSVQMRGKVIRLVLECGLLTEDETRQLCAFAEQYRIKWLSTGTGFHGYPATVDMVKRLRALAPAEMQIKAAGGIRTAADVRNLIEAGAMLIGTSSSTDIMRQK